MEDIRKRIREKRGVDYTEAEIRALAAVKLEKFLDPKMIRSGLLEHYQRQRALSYFAFEEEMKVTSSRGVLGRVIATSRWFLYPALKLFFKPIIDNLYRQRETNAVTFELLNNLVVEITRLSIDMKNQKIRLDALAGRLDLNERRARPLEGVVQYRPGTPEAAGTGKSKGRRAAMRLDAKRRRPSAPSPSPDPGKDDGGTG